MTMSGKITMFLWRLLTIAARVIAMALFASRFRFYVLVFAAAHFTFMFIWMTYNNGIYCFYRINIDEFEPDDKQSLSLEYIFRAMGAFVHIFCFFNLLEGHSRLRCITFYCLAYAENITLILLWHFYKSEDSAYDWYHTPAIVTVIGGFFVGILFELIYYRYCHPNNFSKHHTPIRHFISCKDMSFFGVPPYTDDRWEDEFPYENEALYAEPQMYRPQPHDPSMYANNRPVTPLPIIRGQHKVAVS